MKFKQTLPNIQKFFTAHPKAVGETYLQHGRFAFKVAFQLLWVSFNLMLHGIFPEINKHYAKDKIVKLADTLLKRNLQ